MLIVPYGRRTRVGPWSPSSSLGAASTTRGGIRNPPAGKPYKNERPPSDYFKTEHLGRLHGFSTQLDCEPRLRCAVWTEWCSRLRLRVRSTYGIKEHVQIVEDVLPSPAERQQVFWQTSNRVFRLGLVDTDLVTPRFSPISAVA